MFEENENIFPSKPDLHSEENKARTYRFLFSLVLFIGAFLLLFSDNYIVIMELVVVLILHELGHLIFMKIYGYRSLNMVFVPFLGAMVSGENKKVSQKQKAMVSLMGPLPGIILGCVLFIVAAQGTEPNVYVVEIALLLMAINILNLIPIDPLDGGKILEALFFPTREYAKMLFTLISSIIIIAIGFYTQFYVIMLFGFFMAFKVRSYQKNKAIHDELDQLEFNYKKEYKDLSDREYWTIRKVFLNNNPKIKDVIPSGYMLWENEKLLVEQVNQLLRFEIRKDLAVWQKIIFTVVTLAAIAFPFYLVSFHVELLDWYWENVSIQAGR